MFIKVDIVKIISVPIDKTCTLQILIDLFIDNCISL